MYRNSACKNRLGRNESCSGARSSSYGSPDALFKVLLAQRKRDPCFTHGVDTVKSARHKGQDAVSGLLARAVEVAHHAVARSSPTCRMATSASRNRLFVKFISPAAGCGVLKQCSAGAAVRSAVGRGSTVVAVGAAVGCTSVKRFSTQHAF